MKNKKTPIFILVVILLLAIPFSLASCMEKEDYYTKEDIFSLVSTLENKIAQNKSDYEAALEELTAEYETKQAVLDAEDKANADAIARVEEDYKAAVAELEESDKANADALAALDTAYKAEIKRLESLDQANADAIAKVEEDYKAAVAELEESDKANADALAALDTAYKAEIKRLESLDQANADAIARVEEDYKAAVAELEAAYSEKIATIETLVTALSETSLDNTEKIAALEAQVEELLSRHEHAFGEWINYVGNENVYCENRLFYRICTKCNVLEWKSGTYDNHSFSTVTTPPTCVSMGYDTKTCSICGKIEKINETPISDHIWKDNYSYDNSFHWIDCNYCDAEKEKAEHTTDESGYCTVCDKPVGATEGIIYEISPDGTYASVVGYDGTAVRVKIADMYEGVPVTELCDGVFREKNIVSVIIPNSLTSICSSAFYDCTSLTSVTIGNSVTSIGDYAFFACTSLTSVTIGNSVTSIGDYAFSSCNSALYTEYNYGKYVGDSENPYSVLIGVTNKNFTTYDINEETKIIADNVFRGCERLNSIVIPDSVTSICSSAFSDCYSLTSVHISDIAAWCNISFGDSYSNPLQYARNLYLNGNLVTELVIPDGVTSISNYAFYDCHSLTSVVIPDSVTSIGKSAFSNCYSLRSVVILDGVTSIGSHAFYYCTSLTSVVIPDSVTSIGSDAFDGCYSLTSVHISDIAAWCGISFGGSYANPLYYADNLYLNGNLVTELVIPDGVTSIGDYAFSDCDSLTSVVIPDSVTSIGYAAFYYCYSLTSVTIGDSVTSIGDYAFSNCYNLTSVVIPDSVTSIGYAAFYDCDSLTSVTIGNSLTSIGERAFSGCSSLTSVTIPDSVTSIGSDAFYGCSSLTDVYYGGSKEEWEIIVGNDAFASRITIHFDYVKE